MRVARICRAKYPGLDGEGAALKGGRWNSAGHPVLYTCSCGALAALEYRVHTSEDPADLLLCTIDVSDHVSIELAEWIPDLATSKRFGDSWLRSKRSCILGVLSVVVPNQVNYVLNPAHHEFETAITGISKQPFVLDVRLFDLTAASIDAGQPAGPS